MGSEGLRTGIAIAVALVWVVLALSTIITQNYTALGAVTPVMMIVVGFLFGSKKEVDRRISENTRIVSTDKSHSDRG